MYCLNLMRIALELALHNPVYEDIATKFFEHFLQHRRGDDQHRRRRRRGVGLWDEEDEFYYDELNLPDGRMVKLKVRSMVGLIPLFAVETLEPEMLEQAAGVQRSGWSGSSNTGRTWPSWCRAGTSRAAASGGCCRCCAATA